MSANDDAKVTWMAPEKVLLREALAAGKKLLGVCLGAQILAAVLGAKVSPLGHREIGWFPLQATPEGRGHAWVAGLDEAMVFHWHGEAFEVPKGAKHLLKSAGCATQVFAVGRQALGLQCHVEADAASIGEMLAHGRDEVAAGGAWVQAEAGMIPAFAELERLRDTCFVMLDRFASA